MKNISREQAESLFLEAEVINTKVQQDHNELRVIMTLSSNQVCHVIYDFKSKQKTYQLQTVIDKPSFLPIL